jgi:alpha-L-rhamnosidase
LHDGGASQLIYDMNYRDDVPGYGYQLKKGATALTESWPALAEVSNNHLMLGHIMQWFYEGLGGINQAEDSYGYKKIIIKPEVVGDINFVNASQQTVYGNIVSQWKKTAASFSLDVTIPVNTIAVIYLPAISSNIVLEKGKSITVQKEIKVLGVEKDRVKVQVGSGQYHFVVN